MKTVKFTLLQYMKHECGKNWVTLEYERKIEQNANDYLGRSEYGKY